MTDAMKSELRALLEALHRHPEIGFEEHVTTALLRDALTRHGVAILDSGLTTGLIAQVGGKRPGPVIGLRADIDGLPVEEASGLPYASCHPGRMHACGHDFHAACMAGAAMLLKAREDELPGTVRIIFQPAEEVDAGARQVLATGLTAGCRCFLAGHSYPGFPAGTVGIKEGPVMAAVDRFRVLLRGRGCHAAHPHKGIDPVVAMAALVQSLQTIVSRTLDPFSTSLCSITHAEAGNTWNVIPETAVVEGTIRTLDRDDRARAESRFRQIVAGIAAAYGVEAEIDWHHGSPALRNDARLCALARETAAACGLTAERQEDTLGGEDFSCYLEDGTPGLFVRVGTGGAYPSHHPKFTVDPQALPAAAEYFAALATACLQAEGGAR